MHIFMDFLNNFKSKKLSKPINTSVPSIRFHANAEELEELYKSEEEPIEKPEKVKHGGAGDVESSPLRYLRLGKRSTSIDNSLTSQDSSPPSDPWKFFADIRGKITKRVEDTITEIQHRNQDNESNLKKTKSPKDKDNSSLSDSEDISESSLSKTCGFMSTTEGVEMSSDDETPSIERDKKSEEILKKVESSSSPNEIRNRFKLKSKRDDSTSCVSIKSLKNLYELSTGVKPQLVDDKVLESSEIAEVESGVEAFEDTNLQNARISDTECDLKLTTSASDVKCKLITDEEFISTVVEEINNIKADENQCLDVQKVSGSDLRRVYFDDNQTHTYFAPEGFVDLRSSKPKLTWRETIYSYRQILVLIFILTVYYLLSIPLYVSGFIAGTLFTCCVFTTYNKLFSSDNSTPEPTQYVPVFNSQAIVEIAPIKEHQPIAKFEGWMNEYPDHYDPQTYHISQTQSVYVKIQGNFLRISHTRAKIPKRAMWNEPKHKLNFVQHRIYNLQGAKVKLLPEGLNKKRHWSKKYPICVMLSKDMSDLGSIVLSGGDVEVEEKKVESKELPSSKRSFFTRKKHVPVSPQIFSKLTEEEDEDTTSSRQSSPSLPDDGPSPDISEEKEIDDEVEINDILKFEDDIEEDLLSWPDWNTVSNEDAPDVTCLYLFGRTGREKEDWYRRFKTATHKGATSTEAGNSEIEFQESTSETLINSEKNDNEYLKYMSKLQKVIPFITISKKHSQFQNSRVLNSKSTQRSSVEEVHVLWINALIGRILFDLTRNESFTLLVKERVQKKLSSIKVPYFIEQLIVTDLSLGNNTPIIHRAHKPNLDHRGLWIDLDMTYDGSIILLLQTKLNLMKLKHSTTLESSGEEIDPSAKWQNSDVEDTAESSTDDEIRLIPSSKVLDEFGYPIPGVGGSSNSSKKLIKIVDKIAESKFFQAATENRYIKKAMEGVSNTDLRLKVEVKGLIGTLVLNIPPPPSDRIWIGFRPSPKLYLSAHPIIGERNISFWRQLTSWIEKKLSQEFQKFLVIPNMEDIVIPVMSQKLPE